MYQQGFGGLWDEGLSKPGFGGCGLKASELSMWGFGGLGFRAVGQQ